MRYIKRILLILFLVIMISGCSVEYNVKINKDLSVNDVVYISENTDRLKSRTNMDVNQSVKFLYDIYKFKNMGEKDYSITSSSYTTKVSASNSYRNLEEFAKTYRCDITDSPTYYESDGIIHLGITQTNYIDSSASSRPVYDDITFKIEVPFKVTYHNAEEVKNNQYIWHIKKDSELKTIKIEFDSKKIDNKMSFGFGKNKIDIAYGWILLVVFIVFIGIAILFTYTKNKKSNKI